MGYLAALLGDSLAVGHNPFDNVAVEALNSIVNDHPPILTVLVLFVDRLDLLKVGESEGVLFLALFKGHCVHKVVLTDKTEIVKVLY